MLRAISTAFVMAALVGPAPAADRASMMNRSFTWTPGCVPDIINDTRSPSEAAMTGFNILLPVISPIVMEFCRTIPKISTLCGPTSEPGFPQT
jgi:hypothetical protein